MKNGKKGMDSPPPAKKSEVFDTEGTPKENRRRFIDVMTRVQEELGTEVRHESSNEYLENRLEELNAKAEKTGGLEKLFRSWGETYNRYGLKTKLAVGLGLGLGAGVLSTFSFIGAAACLSGIAAQRVASMSSMFLKYERGIQDEKWGKEKAMGKAMLYTAGMTAGMLLLVEGVKEGVEYANQHQWGERIREWLGHMLEHDNATTEIQAPAQPQADMPTHIVAPLVHEAPDALEMPSVEASTGRGYEYMAKQLWEQLQEKGLDPSQYAEGSDIRRLLEADASSIDKVVHQIAADPEHGFYNTDGTSVRITLDSHMTINADGDIQLDGAVKAPEGTPVTPPYQAETPPSTEIPASASETATPRGEQALPDVTLSKPTESPAIDLTQEQDRAAAGEQMLTTKIDNIPINPAIPAIYEAQMPSGETYLAAYGGSDEERFVFIQEYLARPENQGKTVRFAHEVPSIFGPKLRVDDIGAKTTEGGTSWLLNFFKSPTEPPSPDSFLKQMTK